MDKKDKKNIPKHVGIIMDGNRRWAKERNLPTIEGHAKGYEKMKVVGDWFFSQGVKILSVYAFSTENWNRSRMEVNYLMKLMKKALKDDFEEFNSREYRLLISGRIEELPGDLPEICQEAINKTKKNTKGILNICINYGGRAELIDAFKKIVNKNVTADQIHEGMIRKYLYQAELPDPDIIVRTSGEKRISGFQLWQSAYSEFLFLKKYWPDFERSDAEIIIDEYSNRKRRYGGDEKQ